MSSPYEIHDPRFSRLIVGHAQLERLWTGGRWVEGPVYVPAARSLLWSDIPNDRLMRWDECDGSVSVFETPCGFHNGHTSDAQGRVIACEHGRRRVSRLDHDGVWRPLATRVGGRRFNSPNDVVVHSDGSIWFTDPTYGIDSHYEGHRSASELEGCHVYRLDPATGEATAVVTDMVRPNGLAFSPDERVLYVSDTGSSHDPDLVPGVRAYPIGADGGVGAGADFVRVPRGVVDGFRCDSNGNLWASSRDAVCAFAPDGTHIGSIPIPEIVSNLCFGGPKRNRLFITAQTSLYAIYVNAHAATWTDPDED
ncbi:SMP-30/gluconolactonase/LRE family protein [Aureimonas jatrophae]|uniref:Gluconolactonase n=1 Tax=Aureimonas jatrophae TaxID=1166073 RepID=A0A1H0HVU9_9HYPH|nr:SMP-30/gluconolactonase/LRE family protein [Aureimonas jatrophae]MBB3950804.1 gluconolactonase [Aureimonas jatrophae]SDO23299.1 gluconolactonase [Aureimonas jatrophae]